MRSTLISNGLTTINKDGIITLAYPEKKDVSFEVKVIRKNFYDQESGYGIYQVLFENKTFCIVGEFPLELKTLKYYLVTGKIQIKNHEPQLKVTKYLMTSPTKPDAIIEVLRQLPRLDIKAKKVYDAYGYTILEDIKTNPLKVYKAVASLGFEEEHVIAWQQILLQEKEEEEALFSLLHYNIPPKKAKELMNEYGISIADQIKHNPYKLLSLDIGCRFQDVDAMALSSGIQADDINRIAEAILYVLKDASVKRGDTCLSVKEMGKQVILLTMLQLTETERAKYLKMDQVTCHHRIGENSYEVKKQDLLNKNRPVILYLATWQRIKEAGERLIQNNEIVRRQDDEGDVYYQLDMYASCEQAIEEKVSRLVKCESKSKSEDEVRTALKLVLEKHYHGIILEKEQENAIIRICSGIGGLFLLTGPAGSGKTFVIGIVLKVLDLLYGNMSYQCLAPTGKAAKNISKSTNLPASTIHKYIGKVTVGQSASSAKIMVVDEFSMVDEILAKQMFNEIPYTSKVILLGDNEQLPSIGAGAILRDFMESGVVPHIRLTTVKRQAEGSGILSDAQKVIDGEVPTTQIVNKKTSKNNAYIKNDTKNTASILIDIASERGLKAFQQEKIQLLVPRKLGPTGTNELNLKIQQAVNPWDGETLRIPSNVKVGREVLYFHVGDHVIHVINNYEKQWMSMKNHEYYPTGRLGIMNGEIGNIIAIEHTIFEDEPTDRIIVEYPNGIMFYDINSSKNETEMLLHAYAITVHKAQGSQWKEVVSTLTMSDYQMLNRKILYTLITRAQETLFLIADEETLSTCVENIQPNLRTTFLFKKHSKR